MRNWNLLWKSIFTYSLLCVLSLPMRNWNGTLWRTNKRSKCCSQPTYEELKQSFPEGNRFKRLRSQPTYEELKRITLQEQLAGRVMFSAYLWGIETIYAGYGGGARSRSQPTYEELKHGVSNPAPANRLRSQPTYEELKPQKRYVSIGYICVLSLPMRNWNQIRLNLSSRQKLVLSLPMRNWNWAYNPLFILIVSVLSLPMRNWNPIYTSREEPNRQFSAYLWGIETLPLGITLQQ